MGILDAPALTRQQLGALNVTNLAGLGRWAAARGNWISRPPVVTCLGDSITWGVGSDGTSTETSGPYDSTQQGLYRARAWPVALRRSLNARYGLASAEGWCGLRAPWQLATSTSGTGTSSTIGPFGSYSASGGAGGFSIPNGASVTLGTGSGAGAFTEIDVYYWGSASGVSSPGAPTLTIDGGAASPTTGGNTTLQVLTVTGLADTTHTVVINGPVATTAYVWAVVTRRGGITVNRIGRPGATTTNVLESSTSTTRTRLLQSAVMPGITDLLIVSFGTNDQTAQVALATYAANLQEIIDSQVAGGGCVLLLGEPPAPTPTGTLTEQQYRDTMRGLSGGANPHVAYMDARELWGASFTAGFNLGLNPTSGTVHPSAKGHGVIADALTGLLSLPRYV